MLLKAPWICPVTSEPISHGAVRVAGDLIEEIGSAQEILPRKGEEVVDFPNTVLFPGLVNCHAHLEFSRGPKKSGSFTDWVRQMIAFQEKVTTEEYERNIQRATKDLLASGTTTAACHVGPFIPHHFFNHLPFRTIAFVEVVGRTEERSLAALRAAQQWKVESLIDSDRVEPFITPHSFYSLTEERARQVLENFGPRFSIHLLESADEDQYFRKQAGPLLTLLEERSSGKFSFPHFSPVEFLKSLGALPKSLLIHANYLSPEEIQQIGREKAVVIHCPGSHQFFGHKKFPLMELKKSGAQIALGTDSIASNKTLSMLEEIRLTVHNYPELTLEEVLAMATLQGAKALGINAGALEAGRKADMIGVALTTKNPIESIFEAEKIV
ncbi:MAG: amidohydrolase family protein, partial [bacterium]|nr:amidohydrolase family protein [bacterium]